MNVITDHTTKYRILRNHPILKQIESEIARDCCNSNLISLLKKHLVFFYPKVLSFSLHGFAKEYSILDFNSVTPISDDDVSLNSCINSTDAFSDDINSSDLDALVDCLAKALPRLQLAPIMFIDLRNHRLVDKTKLLAVATKFIDVCLKVVILAPDNILEAHDYQLIRNNVEVLSNIKSFKTLVSSLSATPSHKYEIELAGNLTQAKLDSLFEETVNNSDFKNSLLVQIDVNELYKINPFCLPLLSVYMHSLSHKYGMLWKIECSNDLVDTTLYDYNFIEANNFIIENDFNSKKMFASGLTYGIIKFDESTQKETMWGFDRFLQSLSPHINEYLSDTISIAYDNPNASYKARSTGVSRRLLISRVAYELVDNISLHSDGLGYFFATVTKTGHLYLFIGDTGVGLTKGLQKNYLFNTSTISDRQAVEVCFNLREHAGQRKNSNYHVDCCGYGLSDSLVNIFTCKGKFLYRTGSVIGAYMNPVTKMIAPSKIIESKLNICGTQYLIMFPLTETASKLIPSTTEDFIKTGG